MRRISTIIALALCTLLCVSISSAQQTSTAATTAAAAATSVPNPTHYDGALKDAQSAAMDSKTVGLAATVNPFPFMTGDGIFAAPWGDSISPLNNIFIFGLEHTSLGNATLSKILPPNATGTPSLLVSNIGTGGGDGVSVSLPPGNTYWDAHFNNLGSAQSYQPGSFLQLTGIGTVNGIPYQTVATSRLTDLGSYWAISFDFSPVSSEPLLVVYSLGGLPVGQEMMTDEDVVTTTEASSWNGTDDKECDNCLCSLLVSAKKGGQYVQSSSGNSYFVDSINIMATQLDVPFTGFSAAWETASGIPSFTINDELFTVSGPTTLFSNLGYSRTAYQCCSGLPVSGTGALATSYTQASEFIAGLSGSISQIDVAVGYESGVNSFFVALYSASGNAPGTLIEQWSNVSSSTTFGQCCGLATISGISGVDLVAGTSYFLVLGPTNLSSTTLDTWNLNSSGVTGDTLTATSGCQNGSGNNCNWNSNGVQTIGAFDISGSSGGKSMVKK